MNDSKPIRNGLVTMTDKKKPQRKAATPTVKRPKGRPRRMETEEIKNLEEPIYFPPNYKPRGRPKNQNYLSYEEAREFMLSEMIPSRNKYYEWWDRNKPKAIPRFPYRVYKEWTSWNDFLGTKNEFGIRYGRIWRPLEEAAMYVHKLKIETYAKWMEYCKENTLPNDIPARPDLVYANWKTWGHWLGNRPAEALDAIREAQKLQVYYLIHEQGVPENIITFGVETAGPTVFKERWQREQFDILRMYWYEQEQAPRIKNILDALSTTYLDNDRQRICPNVWEINYYLELTLQRIYKL